MRRRRQPAAMDTHFSKTNQMLDSTDKEARRSMSPRAFATLNILAFALNACETAGIGPFSIRFNENQDNASISAKYQTIITPHGIAFSIWGIIFLMEAIFCLVTLFNTRMRSNSLVIEGVSYWFVLVCLAQTAWSQAFAYEKIPLSAFFMGCILFPLLTIVVRQYQIIASLRTTDWEAKKMDYWLLQFPFEIHCGWICAAFALNLNILGIYVGASATARMAIGAVSLVTLAVAAFVCLGLNIPQFTLPWVVAWATFWMSYELRNPKQLITETFSSDQINDFFVSSQVTSGIIGVATFTRWIQYSFISRKASEESTGLLHRDGEIS